MRRHPPAGGYQLLTLCGIFLFASAGLDAVFAQSILWDHPAEGYPSGSGLPPCLSGRTASGCRGGRSCPLPYLRALFPKPAAARTARTSSSGRKEPAMTWSSMRDSSGRIFPIWGFCMDKGNRWAESAIRPGWDSSSQNRLLAGSESGNFRPVHGPI